MDAKKRLELKLETEKYQAESLLAHEILVAYPELTYSEALKHAFLKLEKERKGNKPMDDHTTSREAMRVEGKALADLNAALAEVDRLKAQRDELARLLKKDINKINQLSDMVNTFAIKLGLGKKVNAEDWVDEEITALAKLKEGE